MKNLIFLIFFFLLFSVGCQPTQKNKKFINNDIDSLITKILSTNANKELKYPYPNFKIIQLSDSLWILNTKSSNLFKLDLVYSRRCTEFNRNRIITYVGTNKFLKLVSAKKCNNFPINFTSLRETKKIIGVVFKIEQNKKGKLSFTKIKEGNLYSLLIKNQNFRVKKTKIPEPKKELHRN